MDVRGAAERARSKRAEPCRGQADSGDVSVQGPSRSKGVSVTPCKCFRCEESATWHWRSFPPSPCARRREGEARSEGGRQRCRTDPFKDMSYTSVWPTQARDQEAVGPRWRGVPVGWELGGLLGCDPVCSFVSPFPRRNPRSVRSQARPPVARQPRRMGDGAPLPAPSGWGDLHFTCESRAALS